MNKTITILTATALVALLAVPAFALETKLSGFYNLRGITNNFSASNNYIGTLGDNVKDGSLADQRLRMKLDTKVNDYLSFTYYAEFDMQWGDAQYSGTPGRNDGGGIGGDTTNMESKNLYIDAKVPDTTSAFRFGLQGLADNYDYSFFAADMAGIKYTGNSDGIDLTAGWFKLGEGDFKISDDVTLWALQVEFKPSDNFKLGGDYYYYQNQDSTPATTTYGWVDDDNDPVTAPIWGPTTSKSHQYATFFGTADIGAVLGAPTWTADRSDMSLHYIGGHAEYQLDSVVLSGWVNYNTGTVNNINNNAAIPAQTSDLDVQGYAARLNAAINLGGLELNLGGTYFSGDDDLSDGDANFIVNPLATESFAFATDGFMIMTPDVAWNSIGQFGFAMVDAAWAGYGLTSVVLTGAYVPDQMKNVHLKAGVGYFSSVEDSLAANDPRTDRAGTSLGTEVFLRAGYKFSDNLDLSVNGAYAFLGNFYENHGGGTAVNTATTTIDDPYEAYLKATLTF